MFSFTVVEQRQQINLKKIIELSETWRDSGI
jgi:hypothetical protein